MKNIAIISLFILFLFSCNNDYSPRPQAYFRIDVPENEYQSSAVTNPNYPYKFEVSKWAKIEPQNTDKGKFWINIVYPQYKGTIYCSYKTIDGNFHELAEDTRSFVYKHTIKADAITEQPYVNEEKKVYGVFYDIKGNTASSVQFVLTDSTSYMFRGALYFNTQPNKDSIAPVLDFVRKDIVHLMETYEKQ